MAHNQLAYRSALHWRSYASDGATSVVSMVDLFGLYLQRGLVEVALLGGAQIDRFGNLNTSVIGSYSRPKVRLPGSGGACEIAINAQRVFYIMQLKKRAFFGPFFFEGSPLFVNGDDIANGASGEPCFMQGRVLSTTGEPLPGAHIEVWQADDDGFYDVQRKDSAHVYGRGHLHADSKGSYYFWSVRPEAYPIPNDGPVGELLDAANRSPMRPAHVHFMITVPGYKTLITHVFKEDDQYLDSDAVFGVRSSLITSFERHEPGIAPDGKKMDVPFYTMHYDFLLPPIKETDGHSS